MNRTRSQLSALDITRHTAIIANAGSGKTAVLVERYLKILLENPHLHPRNIVAITFTDSSARDLRKKISDSLTKKIQDETDPSRRERFIEIKKQISSGYISTIHAFCGQLLRTYPVEANVDASFTILASPEDRLLREESLRATFYTILSEAYADPQSYQAELLPVFRLFGRRKVASLIESFLASRHRIKELNESLYAASDTTILEKWEKMISSFLLTEVVGKIDTDFLGQFVADPSAKGATHKKALEALLSYEGSKTEMQRLSTIPDLRSAFFTKKYTLRAALIPKDRKGDHFVEEKIIAGAMNRSEGLLGAFLDSAADPMRSQMYLNYSRQLLEIYNQVLTRYTQEKIKFSLLDYDDVIEYALRLVQRQDIRSELTRRFSQILIDEYQDTDSAQYQIAKLLTSNFAFENRLSVVGDPKQSIYSFRNADLQLYFDTIKEISETQENNPSVTLSETFRILSHPLAFINIVSLTLFDADKDAKERYNFSPLVEGRNEPKQGTVEIILPLKEGEESKAYDSESEDPDEQEDISADEVALLVLKLQEITSGKSEKYLIHEMVDKIEIIRPARFNEIGILLRNRTHQPRIETELRRNGIPFVTYGGKGFYSSPEIIDITNYLRFLVNPDDDIALAGILRSPYFGLSDIDMYRLAPERNSISTLWQRLTLWFSNNQIVGSTRAIKQLSENLQIVGRISTQCLLQKIITESGILGVIESLPDSGQKIANLEKYSRFALGFTKEGYASTFDFIERITLLMEREEMEAQAEPQNDINAIHIMTIHNAKGLEFPVVFLPYLNSALLGRNQRTIWSAIDKDLGIGVDLPEQEKMQPIVEFIKSRSKLAQIEEEKRIFYVAMTRARDHLILSASPKSSFENTRLGWVFESLGMSYQDEGGSEILVDTVIKCYRDDATFEQPLDMQIPLIRQADDIPILKVDLSS
ncbi:MAG: UvrD-helicase domain-containing protein, partial [Ignavibacteriota bacterium]